MPQPRPDFANLVCDSELDCEMRQKRYEREAKATEIVARRKCRRIPLILRMSTLAGPGLSCFLRAWERRAPVVRLLRGPAGCMTGLSFSLTPVKVKPDCAAMAPRLARRTEAAKAERLHHRESSEIHTGRVPSLQQGEKFIPTRGLVCEGLTKKRRPTSLSDKKKRFCGMLALHKSLDGTWQGRPEGQTVLGKRRRKTKWICYCECR